jgi:hypothetical protein
MKKIVLLMVFFWINISHILANYLFIPMDDTQKNHLKAYGITYWVLQKQAEADWLLNYRGGSFMFKYASLFEKELQIRGITYQVISNAEATKILEEIARPDANMDAVRLDKVPKVAVYSPKSKQPWDDAVTLVLSYAEIPYDIVFDDEVLKGDLSKYDWLHLHHEDFTGQYGKFYVNYRNQPWYIEQQREFEACAKKHGYQKVSQLKLAVVKKIRDFCLGGGFMFAMCSAADTFDIALAAEGVDICESMYDGDPADPQAQGKLNFEKCFAFKDFQISQNPYEYEYSTIDNNPQFFERGTLSEGTDFFNLFKFSAKWDPIPTMLTQNHLHVLKGFMGQTTGFKKKLIKSDVIVMGETKKINEARYIHGTYGKGTWSFYGGHDPEDYQHLVGEEPTDLALHPTSAGYRLILNNILFPAARKKKQKT